MEVPQLWQFPKIWIWYSFSVFEYIVDFSSISLLSSQPCSHWRSKRASFFSSSCRHWDLLHSSSFRHRNIPPLKVVASFNLRCLSINLNEHLLLRRRRRLFHDAGKSLIILSTTELFPNNKLSIQLEKDFIWLIGRLPN